MPANGLLGYLVCGTKRQRHIMKLKRKENSYFKYMLFGYGLGETWSINQSDRRDEVFLCITQFTPLIK